MLYGIYVDKLKTEKAVKILDDAYERAISLITKNKSWPDKLEWGWFENRHIIKTIYQMAMNLWMIEDNNEALELFRNLFIANINDNVGARENILAIRMGLSYDEFMNEFDRGGYYDSDIHDWFELNHKKFPDEFDKWDKLMKEIG